MLLWAAAAKLLGGASARDALRSYGVTRASARTALWSSLIVLELALAVAVAAGVPGAAGGAAVLFALFAGVLALAIARGRAGSPCGCFGARSPIGWRAVGRAGLLALAFALLPLVPEAQPSTETWLGIGLAVALVGVAVLAVALLALARELGELRLAIAPQAALSLEHEGPELGIRVSLIERFNGRAPFALAVFSSPGCALCQALEPSLRLIASDPEIELEVFEEEQDADVWRELGVPGSPYAVVLSPDGEVLAKGTFNSLFQLESVIVAATHAVRA